jgi:hypothetical protein
MGRFPPPVKRQSRHFSRRRLADEGARNVLIDADGQEYAPADFKRLFVEPGPVGT